MDMSFDIEDSSPTQEFKFVNRGGGYDYNIYQYMSGHNVTVCVCFLLLSYVIFTWNSNTVSICVLSKIPYVCLRWFLCNEITEGLVILTFCSYLLTSVFMFTVEFAFANVYLIHL